MIWKQFIHCVYGWGSELELGWLYYAVPQGHLFLLISFSDSERPQPLLSINTK